MSDTMVRARIDPETKAKAEEVLHSMGLSMSGAIRLMLVRVAEEQRLPFELRRPNAETLAAIREAKAGQTEAISLEQLRAALDAIR